MMIADSSGVGGYLTKPRKLTRAVIPQQRFWRKVMNVTAVQTSSSVRAAAAAAAMNATVICRDF